MASTTSVGNCWVGAIVLAADSACDECLEVQDASLVWFMQLTADGDCCIYVGSSVGI